MHRRSVRHRFTTRLDGIASSHGGLVALRCSARQATEEGWVTMHAILMLLYAVGVVLFAAALALALVCWVIDRVVAFSARYEGEKAR